MNVLEQKVFNGCSSRYFLVFVFCLCPSCFVRLSGNAIVAEEPIKADETTLTVEESVLDRSIKLEMAFLRQVVQLSPEQNKQLSSFDVSKLQSARIRQRKIAPGVDFAQVAEAGKLQVVIKNQAIDPLRSRQIERAFQKDIEAILTEDQMEIYAAERKSRDDFYNETSVRGLLILLDKRLSLSKDQYESIRDALSKWSEISTFDATAFQKVGNYLPSVPDSLLLDLLNASQREILRAIPRIDLGNQFQQPFNGDIMIPVH